MFEPRPTLRLCAQYMITRVLELRVLWGEAYEGRYWIADSLGWTGSQISKLHPRRELLGDGPACSLSKCSFLGEFDGVSAACHLNYIILLTRCTLLEVCATFSVGPLAAVGTLTTVAICAIISRTTLCATHHVAWRVKATFFAEMCWQFIEKYCICDVFVPASSASVPVISAETTPSNTPG